MTVPSDQQRITTIGDSVFGVAITLLAYSVRLPQELVGQPLTLVALKPFINSVSGVVLSFVVASLYWLGHWRFLKRVQRASFGFLATNLLVLLGIILLPITTRLFSETPLTSLSVAIYGGNLMLTSIAETAFRHKAIEMSVPEGAPLPRTRIPQTLGTTLSAAMFAISVAVGFVSPLWATWIWLSLFSLPVIEYQIRVYNDRNPVEQPAGSRPDKIN